MISGSLCLQTNAGTASYFLANETTSQTINFTVDTGFPLPSPSTRASLAAGPSTNRSLPGQVWGRLLRRNQRLYDEWRRSLTSGDAITMVDQNGKTLARPVRLTDFTFKTVFVAPL